MLGREQHSTWDPGTQWRSQTAGEDLRNTHMGRAPRLLAVAATATMAPASPSPQGGGGTSTGPACTVSRSRPGPRSGSKGSARSHRPPWFLCRGVTGAWLLESLGCHMCPNTPALTTPAARPTVGALQPMEPSPAHCRKAQPEPETPVLGPAPAPRPPPLPCLCPPHLWSSSTATRPSILPTSGLPCQPTETQRPV